MFSFFFFLFSETQKSRIAIDVALKKIRFILLFLRLSLKRRLSDELWDNLSSCFQLRRRSHQTFHMGLISIKA